jgi:tetratricopeptide (TPR) repeat protein
MDDQELKKADKIDRYLKGVMPTEEKEAFEMELSRDESLKEEVEKTDISQKAIQYNGLRKEVRDIRSHMLKEESTSPLGKEKGPIERPLPVGFYALRVAASLFLVILSFAIIQSFLVDPQSIYSEKINYEVVDVVERSSEESATLSNILEAYQKDNFKDAAAIFSQLENPSVKEQYIAAAAYLRLGEFEQAISNYQKILNGNTLSADKDYWQQRAAYNLAITYVKVGNYQEAILILEELKSNGEYGNYYDQLVSDYALWKLRLLDTKASLFD